MYMKATSTFGPSLGQTNDLWKISTQSDNKCDQYFGYIDIRTGNSESDSIKIFK